MGKVLLLRCSSKVDSNKGAPTGTRINANPANPARFAITSLSFSVVSLHRFDEMKKHIACQVCGLHIQQPPALRYNSERAESARDEKKGKVQQRNIIGWRVREPGRRWNPAVSQDDLGGCLAGTSLAFDAMNPNQNPSEAVLAWPFFAGRLLTKGWLEFVPWGVHPPVHRWGFSLLIIIAVRGSK